MVFITKRRKMSKKDIKLIDLKATLSAVGKSIFVSFYVSVNPTPPDNKKPPDVQ